ncbi:MAG: PD-(D/E)XK nuclease family protein, partial [Candidatus Binataceae bacterium]
ELKATRDAAYRDIAILLRAFSDVAIYERALLEAGVPCYTVKGRGFYGCREVLDLADLVGAIDDRRDSIALAAVLRSPLFALSDPCLLEIGLHARAHRASLAGLFSADAPDFAWLKTDRERAEATWRTLKELRAMVRRSSLVEVLEHALEATDFEAVMLAQSDGAQRVANIRKLVELALIFQARRCFTFADFAAHLRRLVDESPDEPQAQILAEGQNVVRIMTIHQAKGLEFPVVIVADIGRGAPPREHNYLLSPKRGLLMREAVGSGGDELPNPLVEEHLERVSRMEKAEAARLLYVAMTRARDLLILSEGPQRGEWARQVREFVAEGTGQFPGSNGAERIIEAHGNRILLHASELQRRSAPTGVEKRVGADELAGLARARLEFSPPPDTELIASPTELADFERCPRQYRLRHVLELPEGASFGADPGHAIEMGIVAHAVLERLDRGLAGRTLEDEIARLVGAMAAGKGLDPGRRAALARDIVRYAASREGAERIVGREVPFFLSVAESDVALFVRGRIDVIVERDGRLVVRDYKYARGDQTEPQTYRVQMECYALAAQSEYPGRPVDAELIFIRDRVSVARLPIADAEEIRNKLAALGRAALAAARTDRYPIKPTGPEACRRLGCGYIRRCWGAD